MVSVKEKDPGSFWWSCEGQTNIAFGKSGVSCKSWLCCDAVVLICAQHRKRNCYRDQTTFNISSSFLSTNTDFGKVSIFINYILVACFRQKYCQLMLSQLVFDNVSSSSRLGRGRNGSLHDIVKDRYLIWFMVHNQGNTGVVNIRRLYSMTCWSAMQHSSWQCVFQWGRLWKVSQALPW